MNVPEQNVQGRTGPPPRGDETTPGNENPEVQSMDYPILDEQIPYGERPENFYSARRQVLARGPGEVHARTVQYLEMLKDHYEENLAAAYIERDEMSSSCKELQLKLDKSKTNNEILRGKMATRDQMIGDLSRERQVLATTGHVVTPTAKIFTVQVKELPVFRGEKNAEKVITFLTGLERVFVRRARETNTRDSTDGWGDYAVGQLKDGAAQWGQCEWPTRHSVDWEAFKTKVRAQYIPASAQEEVEGQLAALQVGPKQSIKEFNYTFLQLRLKLRIIEGNPLDNEADQNVIKSYVTKIRAASKDEPATRNRMKAVWASWAQWKLSDPLRRAAASLSDVMMYFQTMDDALQGETDDIPKPGTSNIVTTIASSGTVAAAGVDPDAMDLSKLEVDKLELFKLGVEFANRGRSGQRGTDGQSSSNWRYRSNGNSSRNSSRDSSSYGNGQNWNNNRNDNRNSRSNDNRDQRNKSGEDDWKKDQRCWNCGIFGHLRMMNDVLKPHMRRFVVVYLDDVLIFSDSEQEHVGHVMEVLQLLAESGLKLSRDKCAWFQKKIEYVGFWIDEEGVHTDDDKIKGIQEWPVPKTPTEMRQFLGLTQFYRKFVENYAHVACPLYDLTADAVDFEWTPECEMAFRDLKIRLTTAPVLALPRPGLPLMIRTDASNFAIGAVLTQMQDDRERVIAYYSRKLKPAETRYPTYDRELLAIRDTMLHWRIYLHGVPTVVYTDHSSLRHVLTQKNLSARQLGYLSTLQEFDYKVKYWPGAKNEVADALSRRPDYVEAVLKFGSVRELTDAELSAYDESVGQVDGHRGEDVTIQHGAL